MAQATNAPPYIKAALSRLTITPTPLSTAAAEFRLTLKAADMLGIELCTFGLGVGTPEQLHRLSALSHLPLEQRD